MIPKIIEMREPSADAGWICRSCACVSHLFYKYPPSPWSYCARCRSALSVEEQLVAVARLRVEGALPDLAGVAPVQQPATSGSGMPVKPLMSVKEVAVLLNTTPGAIYKLIERKLLPGVTHVGRRVHVRRVELLRSLAEGRVPSPGRSR